MVASHWSDDGMVTIHRSGLPYWLASSLLSTISMTTWSTILSTDHSTRCNNAWSLWVSFFGMRLNLSLAAHFWEITIEKIFFAVPVELFVKEIRSSFSSFVRQVDSIGWNPIGSFSPSETFLWKLFQGKSKLANPSPDRHIFTNISMKGAQSFFLSFYQQYQIMVNQNIVPKNDAESGYFSF